MVILGERARGLSKCTDSEGEEKRAYLERGLGVKIYRTWDQLAEGMRNTDSTDNSWVSD